MKSAIKFSDVVNIVTSNHIITDKSRCPHIPIRDGELFTDECGHSDNEVGICSIKNCPIHSGIKENTNRKKITPRLIHR